MPLPAVKFHADPDFDPQALSAEVAPLRAGERIRLLHERWATVSSPPPASVCRLR
jgi:hypothetical protein